MNKPAEIHQKTHCLHRNTQWVHRYTTATVGQDM